jgi:hypothetical protein
MSAVDTVRQVLDWAALGEGPPPHGDLDGAEQLARPDPRLVLSLARLGAVTAARLRVAAVEGAPETGLDGLVLAAALGSRQAVELARALVATLPAPCGTWECLVRHGLAATALAFVPEEMADDLRAASPLSGLLERPAPGEESAALAWVRRLRGDRQMRQALVVALAHPAAPPAVRRWRAELLDRSRLDGEDGRSFVLDVYETAILHHEAEWIDVVRAARAVLLDPRAVADAERLDEAAAAADWWGALAALDRTHLAEVRQRRHLGYSYREALRLHAELRRLRGNG